MPGHSVRLVCSWLTEWISLLHANKLGIRLRNKTTLYLLLTMIFSNCI